MFLRQVRYSARSLARSPGTTAMLLLSIAVGVGSNAAVVGFVRGIAVTDLPPPATERVVSIFGRNADGAFEPLSPEEFRAVSGEGVFETVGAARESRARVLIAGRSTVMMVAAVTPELASLFGVPADRGAVVSTRTWHEHLRAKPIDPEQRLRVEEMESSIAGVAPEWLEGLYAGGRVDVWLPLEMAAGEDLESRTLSVVGRVPDGLSAAEAERRLNANRSGAELLAVLPYTGLRPEAAASLRRISTLLGAAAVAVFLIACANVSAFLIARASARSRETAVCVALGATRRQLALQLLSESLLISIGGAAFGLLFALWTARALPSFFYAPDAEQLTFVPDVPGVLLATAVCGVITVACGLVPLFNVRDDRPSNVLSRESLGTSKTVRRVSAGLVLTQMTCCCVLIVAAGLLLEGFRTSWRTSSAQRLGPTVLVTVEAAARFAQPERGTRYFLEVEAAARSVSNVTAAAWTSTLPGGRPASQPFRIDRRPETFRPVPLQVVPFTPDAMAGMTLPPLAGRMFGGADTPKGCRVVVLNETAAATLFDGRAVGRTLRDPAGETVQIIGVVAAARDRQSADRAAAYYYPQQGPAPVEQARSLPFRVPAAAPLTRGVLDVHVVSDTYFGLIGVERVAGEVFTEPGDRECRVGVINERAAALYFGGDPIGGAVIDESGVRTSIIGVVRSEALRTSQRRSEPALYLPMRQDFLPRMTLVAPARTDDDVTRGQVARRTGGVEGGRMPPSVTTLETHLARTALAADRIATVLVAVAAGMSVALGIVGLYGAMTEAGRQRRREFAVRLALGAGARHVIGQVLAQATRLAAAGALIGSCASVIIAWWLARMMPAGTSLVWWIWVAAPATLLSAVALAGLLPIRRALRVDLVRGMRDD